MRYLLTIILGLFLYRILAILIAIFGRDVMMTMKH